MKKRHSIVPLAISTLLLALVVGCASRPVFAPVANVPKNRSLVYFYGPDDGSFYQCRIDYNGKRLTKLKPGQYFAHIPVTGTNSYTVEQDYRPGLVGFMLDKPAADVTRIRMQPGRSYYVKALGLGTLMRVDENTALSEIKQCRLTDSGDIDPAEVPPPPVKSH